MVCGLSTILLLSAVTVYAELKTAQAADVVIGQANFTSNAQPSPPTARSLASPDGCTFCDGQRLFIPDSNNNRVLIYNSIPTTNNAPADIVIGQTNFTSSAATTTRTGLSYPGNVFYDGKKLFIPEYGNSRVLIYNSLPTTNGAPADVVIGQADFTHGTANQGGTVKAYTLNKPTGVFSDGKRLFIADYLNNRVLIYNSIPTSNNASADVVIGQASFTTSTATATRTGLSTTADVYYDGKRLFVMDAGNNRVLIYNSIPATNGAPADVVVGQVNFTNNSSAVTQTGLNFSCSVLSDGKRLFVGDYNNSRVLVYNSIPTTNGAAADIVLGQTNFTSSGTTPVTASSLNFPYVRSDGKRLIVTDYGNNRILIYKIAGSSPEKLGPQFEQGKALIGKVFNDLNGNGIQDNGENGIEGVKVATDTGIYAITDEDGKYHFPYIEVGQHLLKIDPSTLPEGSVITTDNPYKVTVTEGVMTKVSFGVKLPIVDSKKDDKPLLKVSVSQDPVMLKPRLSISHKLTTPERNNAITQERNNETIVFSIECNYYLFIAKSTITIYDSSYKVVKTIDLPNPIPSTYTLPISDLPNPITLKPNNPITLYYQLTVYDKNGKKDRAGVGSLEI